MYQHNMLFKRGEKFQPGWPNNIIEMQSVWRKGKVGSSDSKLWFLKHVSTILGNLEVCSVWNLGGKLMQDRAPIICICWPAHCCVLSWLFFLCTHSLPCASWNHLPHKLSRAKSFYQGIFVRTRLRLLPKNYL